MISNCVFKLYFLYMQIWKSNIYKEECKLSMDWKKRHENKMSQVLSLVCSEMKGWFDFNKAGQIL